MKKILTYNCMKKTMILNVFWEVDGDLSMG